jgi:hypothetical protein
MTWGELRKCHARTRSSERSGGDDGDDVTKLTFSKRRIKAEALRNTVVEPLEEGGVELVEGDAVI